MTDSSNAPANGRRTIILTRDSVCAGDDADAPHERRVELGTLLDAVALAEQLAANYLPHVAGNGHSWDCVVNGRSIARVTPDLKATPTEFDFEPGRTEAVHFKYNSSTF
jgi:hypothetical protein